MKYQRLHRFLRRKLYKEETGFLLNYLTLRISDQQIMQKQVEHRVTQFRRFDDALIFFSIISLLMTVYSLYGPGSRE